MSDDIKTIALECLKQVCLDLSAPASARAAAGRTLLEAEGVIGRLQLGAESAKRTKPLSEMTASEIEAEITRLKEKDASGDPYGLGDPGDDDEKGPFG